MQMSELSLIPWDWSTDHTIIWNILYWILWMWCEIVIQDHQSFACPGCEVFTLDSNSPNVQAAGPQQPKS